MLQKKPKEFEEIIQKVSLLALILNILNPSASVQKPYKFEYNNSYFLATLPFYSKCFGFSYFLGFFGFAQLTGSIL